MAVRLPLPGASLLLDTSGDWCAVWLEVGGERRHLGSESEAVVHRRLLSHLAQPGEAVGEIDGCPVHLVLSLAEGHCTLYVQFAPDGRRLLVEGPQGEWLWRGALPDAEWRAWQVALASPVAPPDRGDV